MAAQLEILFTYVQVSCTVSKQIQQQVDSSKLSVAKAATTGKAK